jgi:hypothetical protein
MIVGIACLCTFSAAFAADIPTGKLNVDRTLVPAGSRPQLDWRIQYPVPVTELLKAQMRVRVLGASFQEYKTNNGGGNNLDGVDSSNASNIKKGIVDPSGTYDDEKKFGKAIQLPVEVMWSLNNSSWSRLFYGTQSDVNPSTIVLNTPVKSAPADIIHFGAHGYRNGAWLPFYSTATPSQNVVVLKNGDSVPTIIQQSFIDSTLKPYLAADNKVKIGTRDLIVLMELGQTNPIYADFNLQDLVLLVTFEESAVK